MDTGSQRSYSSETAAKNLCQDINKLYALECDLCTCIGEERKEFIQMSSGKRILDGRIEFLPFLVDGTLDITFGVPVMNGVINNFKLNALLNEAFNEDQNHVIQTVDILLGLDVF